MFCQSHPPRTTTLNVSANYMQHLLPYPSLVRAHFFFLNRHIMDMDGHEHITVIVLNYNLDLRSTCLMRSNSGNSLT